MNNKLEAISATACLDLAALIAEREKEILEAWSEAEEEAQANETKPVFRLGFTVALDLDADKMQSTLSFSIRRKATAEHEIPDPSQRKLPLEDTASPGLKPGSKMSAGVGK